MKSKKKDKRGKREKSVSERVEELSEKIKNRRKS